MATRSKTTNAGSKKLAQKPRSIAFADEGIKTGHDFANFMSALMSDLISGRVSPNVGNAAVNAGGKLLKVVEMQLRYGTNTGTGGKVLQLAVEQPLMPQNNVQ